MKVLAIAAHPDDETIFAGGFLAKLAEDGHELTLLMVTRGEGGEVGVPPVGLKSSLGEYREREARGAAAALGARDIRFLGYTDPSIEIGEDPLPIPASLEEFASSIAREMAEVRPDLVITHGTDGEYGHPQHVYTHRATREALRKLAPWRPAQFLSWSANGGVNVEDRLTNKNDPATFVLDISPWFEKKVAAAECHVSQHDLFKRNSQVERVRDMVRRVEAFRQWDWDELVAPDTGPEEVKATSDWTAAHH